MCLKRYCGKDVGRENIDISFVSSVEVVDNYSVSLSFGKLVCLSPETSTSRVQKCPSQIVSLFIKRDDGILIMTVKVI